MIETDAPSTEEVVSVWCCARPTGGGMFAPLRVQRNAEIAQSEGSRRSGWETPLATAFTASALLF
jgi:hypothetical protein